MSISGDMCVEKSCLFAVWSTVACSIVFYILAHCLLLLRQLLLLLLRGGLLQELLLQQLSPRSRRECSTPVFCHKKRHGCICIESCAAAAAAACLEPLLHPDACLTMSK